MVVLVHGTSCGSFASVVAADGAAAPAAADASVGVGVAVVIRCSCGF